MPLRSNWQVTPNQEICISMSKDKMRTAPLDVYTRNTNKEAVKSY